MNKVPGTAARAAAAADAVAWTQVEAIASSVIDKLPTDERYMPDVDWFRYVVNHHVDWLREATETGRGVVVVQSY